MPVCCALSSFGTSSYRTCVLNRIDDSHGRYQFAYNWGNVINEIEGFITHYLCRSREVEIQDFLFLRKVIIGECLYQGFRRQLITFPAMTPRKVTQSKVLHKFHAQNAVA